MTTPSLCVQLTVWVDRHGEVRFRTDAPIYFRQENGAKLPDNLVETLRYTLRRRLDRVIHSNVVDAVTKSLRMEPKR